jgi:AraC-like DNA-binding protein
MNSTHSSMSSRLDRPAPSPSVDSNGAGRGYERTVPVYPILHLKPPYTPSATAVMVREVDATKIVPGSVLALHITARNIDWSECSETVRGLRHRLPSVPVVLSLGPDIPDGLFLAGQAARASVRAVVSGNAPLGESLRRPLTDTQTLGADVVEWLGLFGLRLTPTLSHLITHIFSDAPRFREVADLLREIGAAESSTRFRFRKKGLPAPSRWLQAARGLHAALRIQLDPERSILAHACDLGYADHSALCHQMRRLFGTTPAAVRGTLGWEWLLERWVRSNILTGRPLERPTVGVIAVREPVRSPNRGARS